MGRDYATNIVVMDVEGNDSYESHAEGDEVLLVICRTMKKWFQVLLWFQPIY